MTGGIVAAFLSSCAWVVGVSFYARVARIYSAPRVNATRALVAAPLFALLLLVQGGGPSGALGALLSIRAGQLACLLVSVISSFALADSLFLRSAVVLGVPAALSIASSFPLWAALGGMLLRGEALSFARAAGVVTVVSGTVLVILSGADRARKGVRLTARERTRGVALAVATSMFWALNIVCVSAGSEGVPVGAAGLYRMAFALVLCPPIGSVLGRRLGTGTAAGNTSQASLFLPSWLVKKAGWIFAVEAFGGTLFFIYGLSHTPVAIGAALSSLAPVLAVPIALGARTERFSVPKTLGIIVVVAGVIFLVS